MLHCLFNLLSEARPSCMMSGGRRKEHVHHFMIVRWKVWLPSPTNNNSAYAVLLLPLSFCKALHNLNLFTVLSCYSLCMVWISFMGDGSLCFAGRRIFPWWVIWPSFSGWSSTVSVQKQPFCVILLGIFVRVGMTHLQNWMLCDYDPFLQRWLNPF